MEPNDLARELGITGKKLRDWLRASYPRGPVDHGAPWNLTSAQVAAARQRFKGSTAGVRARPSAAGGGPRSNSDEAYVIDLCDEVLGERASRQHCFPWLVGDASASGARRSLPVDAYYPSHRLVVEYRERQHDEPVAHFDKPDRLTVSGVHRGEQRRLYDERREEELPAHGLRLMVIRPSDLAATPAGRLRRHRTDDIEVVRSLLGDGGR